MYRENIATTFTITRDTDNGRETQTLVINEIPQNISYSYSPDFNSYNVLGRPTPLYIYGGSKGKSYSFVLDLHEDVHARPGETLQDLVYDIKSMSFPSQILGGTMSSYPQVMITIGQLKELVIVETEVTWKKPYRDGRYIGASIRFNIKVIKPLKEPLIRVVQETVGQSTIVGDVEYRDVYAVYYSEEQKSMERLSGNYGVYLRNIVNTATLIGANTISKSWDVYHNKLTKLFGAYKLQMATQKKGSAEYTALSDVYNKVNNYNLTELSTNDAKELIKNLETLKKEHETFIKYYYEEINEDLLATERDLIKDNVNVYVDTLIQVIREAYGLGATS